MEQELISQVVQIPYSDGRSDRTDEIVREVEAATGLEVRTNDFAALFRGEGLGLSHAGLQVTVESAMPPDWRDHFSAPMEAEQGAWPG